MPPGVSVISCYKPFWKSGSSYITGGLVDLDVGWIDQSTSPTQWTVANVAHLSVTHLDGHAHLWSQKGPIFETACNG